MAYEKSFKEEAVKLAQEIGTRKVSEQLGVAFYTLREWQRTQERYGENAFVGRKRSIWGCTFFRHYVTLLLLLPLKHL